MKGLGKRWKDEEKNQYILEEVNKYCSRCMALDMSFDLYWVCEGKAFCGCAERRGVEVFLCWKIIKEGVDLESRLLYQKVARSLSALIFEARDRASRCSFCEKGVYQKSIRRVEGSVFQLCWLKLKGRLMSRWFSVGGKKVVFIYFTATRYFRPRYHLYGLSMRFMNTTRVTARRCCFPIHH